MTGEERCERTELLVDQCAHCRSQSSVEEQAEAELHDLGVRLMARDPRWFFAEYPGTCTCGSRFKPGMPIRLTLGGSLPHWVAPCCANKVR